MVHAAMLHNEQAPPCIAPTLYMEATEGQLKLYNA